MKKPLSMNAERFLVEYLSLRSRYNGGNLRKALLSARREA
jgi:hypothetical protein